MLLSYPWGPMPWMIEAAILLGAVVGDWVDFVIILGLLVGNTAIANAEESSAGDAVAALKAKLALEALVKRDDQWLKLPASALVPLDRVPPLIDLQLAIGGMLTTHGTRVRGPFRRSDRPRRCSGQPGAPWRSPR